MTQRDDREPAHPGAEETIGNPTHAADSWPPVDSEVSRSLSGLDYPATRDDLVSKAREQGAGEAMLHRLDALEERVYQSVGDVEQAYRRDVEPAQPT